MYGLLWLLSTFGENFMSAATLEIYLLRNIIILPAVCLYVCVYVYIYIYIYISQSVRQVKINLC